MTTKQKKTHFLKNLGDFRIQGLEEMFKGFNNALNTFEQKFNDNQWYCGDSFRNETELICGMVLVSLQNYINGWCSDFRKGQLYGYGKNYEYYSRNAIMISDDISQIKLIIELANYFKHKDDKRDLNGQTKECLMKLDLLQYRSSYENGFMEDLIYEGLSLLCPGESNIHQLLPIVKEWRDKSIEDL